MARGADSKKPVCGDGVDNCFIISGSLMTIKCHGCAFSAVGAAIAARSNCSIFSCSTSLCWNTRQDVRFMMTFRATSAADTFSVVCCCCFSFGLSLQAPRSKIPKRAQNRCVLLIIGMLLLSPDRKQCLSGDVLLCKGSKIFLCNELQIIIYDSLACLVCIVGTENKYSLTVQKEGV